MKDDTANPASVLVVDDFPSTAELLALVLKREGYDAVAVDSGEAALRAFQMNHFDLIVSDIFLPGISGYDLLRTLRAQRPIPAISISGNLQGKDPAKSRAAGFDDHLNKPIAINQFLGLVHRILGSKRQSSDDARQGNPESN